MLKLFIVDDSHLFLVCVWHELFYKLILLFNNVMNTVSVSVSICLLERNILVPTYFGVSF